MSNTVIPLWCMSESLSFRYAPAPVRRAAGAIGLHAKWFAQRRANQEENKIEAFFWNNRRAGRVFYSRKE